MKLLLLAAFGLVAVLGTCPLGRPLKIAMYPYIAFLDGYGPLKTKLEADFLTATGCTADLTFSFDINPYKPPIIKQALQACGSPAVQPCGFDMAEVDTVTLDDLVSTPNLLREMPDDVKSGIHDFMPQARKMVKIDGVQWAQPSYACDNLFMTFQEGIEDVSNRAELLDWIDDKMAGNTSKLGYTTDLWAVYDLTTIYVDAFIDTKPNKKKLCCSPGTAYYPVAKPSVARGLNDLAVTCYDNLNNYNPCLDGTFYNDFFAWFNNLISGRSVMIQGFSSYMSDIRDMGGNINNLHVTTATLGTSSQGYMFADAFVLSKANCGTGSGCVAAATKWLNWQKLDGQLIINLGLDGTPPRPRYLVSANEEFYASPLVDPYRTIYDFYFNDDCDGTLQLARPLDTEHYTDHHCDLYASVATYVPTGSSCALQGHANQV